MCEIISSLSIRRDKLLATMETMNMEVDYLKQFKRYEITEIDPKVHPKVGPLIRARDEYLSSPRLQIPKIKVHRSSKTCGKSLIQEAEGQINEISHEIKKKEPKNGSKYTILTTHLYNCVIIIYITFFYIYFN